MSSDQRARRYAIVSGKGGVGKTVITANLAAALARAGQRTLVLDADLGLANLDVILGVNATGTLQDVLTGSRGVAEALVHTRTGFDLLAAGSGIARNNPLDSGSGEQPANGAQGIGIAIRCHSLRCRSRSG